MSNTALELRSSNAGQNLLLAERPDAVRALVHALEPVTLELGQTLVDLGEIASHVYFPIHGVISVLSTTRRGDSVEVAAIGSEGVAALTGMLGSGTSPFRLLVQMNGTAFRILSDTLLDHLFTNAPFRHRVFQYLHVTVGQITQSAVCNRYHKGSQRLARWLLSVSDRARSDVLPVTHEFAAVMVGDQRPRVTAAIRHLSERGLIRHRRGEITIVDREKLAKASCECYTTVRTYFTEFRGSQ